MACNCAMKLDTEILSLSSIVSLVVHEIVLLCNKTKSVIFV